MKRKIALAVTILVMICAAACIAEDGTDPAAIAAGDVITFGHYAQDTDPNNGKEPIEWIVLDV